MRNPELFKWRHCGSTIILWCLRWYLQTAFTYRQMKKMLAKHGLPIVHATNMHWVHRYVLHLRVIDVNKHAFYPAALTLLKAVNQLKQTQLWQVRYLNNVVEADHRFVKRKTHFKQWFQTLYTARYTIVGYEAMNIFLKAN